MKYSLAQPILFSSLSALVVSGLTSANLHFVFAVTNILFATNLFLSALVFRGNRTQRFWLGFAVLCWGIQVMEQSTAFANVTAVFLCDQHGYFVSIPSTEGMKPNETYFTPYYPSGACNVYSHLVVQVVALLLGFVGGTIASYGQSPLTERWP